MKCDRHTWDTDDKEWCWKCEELTINENKKKYEDKFCDNSLQRVGGNQEVGSIHIGTQESSRRDCGSI
jgi:hypothetical protein